MTGLSPDRPVVLTSPEHPGPVRREPCLRKETEMDPSICPDCGHDMDLPVYCGECCNPECPCDEDEEDDD